MGAYLATPVTAKESSDGRSSGGAIRWGASSMQGWRKTMEDAHVTETDVLGEPDSAVFGVFDGHGGSEVARFCQTHLMGVLAADADFKARAPPTIGCSVRARQLLLAPAPARGSCALDRAPRPTVRPTDAFGPACSAADGALLPRARLDDAHGGGGRGAGDVQVARAGRGSGRRVGHRQGAGTRGWLSVRQLKRSRLTARVWIPPPRTRGRGCVVQIQGTIEATMAEAKVGGRRCCSVSLSLLAPFRSVRLADCLLNHERRALSSLPSLSPAGEGQPEQGGGVLADDEDDDAEKDGGARGASRGRGRRGGRRGRRHSSADSRVRAHARHRHRCQLSGQCDRAAGLRALCVARVTYVATGGACGVRGLLADVAGADARLWWLSCAARR